MILLAVAAVAYVAGWGVAVRRLFAWADHDMAAVDTERSVQVVFSAVLAMLWPIWALPVVGAFLVLKGKPRG